MRVLYFSPLPPPAGGIATLTDVLIRKGLPGDFCIDVVNTAVRGRTMHSRPSLSGQEIRRYVSIATGLANALVRFRPDIVHINSSLNRTGIFRDLAGAAAARMAGARVLTHYHGSLTFFTRESGLPILALNRLMAMSQANVASNAADLEYMRRSGHAGGPALCLRNYIDTDKFSESTSERSPTPRAPLRGIYVGALTQPKGAHDIVEVARRRPDLSFTLANASIVDSFRPVMASLPPNVELRIDLTSRELIALLKARDFFIFLSYHEGFPLALTEAMYAGLPVVATRVGSVPEMIDEGRGGFLCEPGNVDGALCALDSLVASADVREMGNYNYRKAQAQYTFDAVGRQLAAIYLSLLH